MNNIANRHIVKILRFLVSGGTAAVVEFASFVCLMNVFGVLIVSNTASFTLGFIVSFSLNRKWVFQSDGVMSKQIMLYFLLALANLILSNLLVVGIVHIAGENFILLAKIGAMAMVAIWNYVIFSKVIFTARKNNT